VKKTDEALSKTQEEALIYQQKIEAGKVRLVPEKPTPKSKQEDEFEQQTRP
jgi:hypothetical protein